MKSLKSKIPAVTLILALGVFVTGCSKQDKKETTENKEQKTEILQQKNDVKQDSSELTKMDKQDVSKNNKEGIEHKTVKIPTAQCDVCKENITKALKKVSGVKTFDVDIDGKVVRVNFDKTVTDMNKIEKAITSAGYDANNKKADPDAYEKLDNCCKKPEDRKK